MVNSLTATISVAHTQMWLLLSHLPPFHMKLAFVEGSEPELKLEQVEQNQQYSLPDCREQLSAVAAC